MNIRTLLVALLLAGAPLVATLAQGASSGGGVCAPPPLTVSACVDCPPSLCAIQLPCDPAEASTSAGAPSPVAAVKGCLPVDPLPPRLPGATACGRGATSFSFRLNTGASAAGAPLATGSPDPVWKVGPAAPNGPAYAKGAGVDPGAWVQVGDAAWVNPYPASVVGGPLVDWSYGAAFVVPATAYGVTVSGSYALDNIGGVTLAPGSFAAYASPANAFTSLNAFSWSGVSPGTYTLGAHVHNGALGETSTSSPTGLLVEATVKGLCKHNVFVGDCSNGATGFTIVLNTGIGPYGNPLPAGSTDPRWVSALPPSATWTHAAFAGWVTDPSSSWINTNPVGTASLTGVSFGSADYQLHYVVPANAYNVVLSGKFAADNSGTFADTDAKASWLVASTPSPYGFSGWTSLYHPINVNGPHTVDVQVTDQGGQSGVNVVATVTGQCAKIVDVGSVKGILNELL